MKNFRFHLQFSFSSTRSFRGAFFCFPFSRSSRYIFSFWNQIQRIIFAPPLMGSASVEGTLWTGHTRQEVRSREVLPTVFSSQLRSPASHFHIHPPEGARQPTTWSGLINSYTSLAYKNRARSPLLPARSGRPGPAVPPRSH